jgi:CMP-N-acetylneuraminic acid synthetase
MKPLRPVCIIPARGSSTRISRKNMRLVNGKPLLWYILQDVKAAGLADRTIVVTDDDEIESYAMLSDVMVCREPTVVDESTIRAAHYGWKYALRHGIQSGVIVLLFPTSPCFKPGLIFDIAEWCEATGGPVQSIVKAPPLAYQCVFSDKAVLKFFAPLDLSQNFEQSYMLSGCAVACYPSMFNRDYSSLLTFYKDLPLYGMLHDDPHCDIDSQDDFLWLEYLVQSGRYPHLL